MFRYGLRDVVKWGLIVLAVAFLVPTLLFVVVSL